MPRQLIIRDDRIKEVRRDIIKVLVDHHHKEPLTWHEITTILNGEDLGQDTIDEIGMAIQRNEDLREYGVNP